MCNTALFVLTMGSVFALGLSPAAAAKPQAVVFPVEKAGGLSVGAANLETLRQTIAATFTSHGTYVLVPDKQVQGALRGSKSSGSKHWITIGKKLKAHKAVVARLDRSGRLCKLDLSVWDVSKAAVERTTTVESECSTAVLLASMKRAAGNIARAVKHSRPGRSCEVGTKTVSGYCCWPGQTWDLRSKRCTGRPTRCPRGAEAVKYGCHDAKLPNHLGRSQIIATMRGLKKQVLACFDRYRQPGVYIMVFSVAPTGRLHDVGVEGEFGGTPTAACLSKVAWRLRFPRANRGMTFRYPMALR